MHFSCLSCIPVLFLFPLSDHVFAVFGALFTQVSVYCFFPIVSCLPMLEASWSLCVAYVLSTFHYDRSVVRFAVDVLIQPCVSEKPIL